MILLLLCPAGVWADQAPTDSLATQAEASAAYTIGPEDILDIRVWKNDAISCIVQVRPDGMISLPLVNDVRAADRTPQQLREELLRRLAQHMANPEVSILVKEVSSYTVAVVGEVVKPGRYDIRGPTTVLEVLAEAGGLTPFASRSRLAVLRRQGGEVLRIPFNYSQAIRANGERENFALMRGDIVLVP